MKPTPGYVIIEPKEVDQTTSSGLYVPKTGEEKPEEGLVLAVGNRTKEEDPPCKKGDRVIYKKWASHTIKRKDKTYEFLKFSDILAVL